jgi:homoserine O-acetyltransferase
MTRTVRLLFSLSFLSACHRTPPSPAANGSPERRALFAPDAAIFQRPAPALFRVAFETSAGPFTVEIHRDWAPIGVDRLYHLVQAGFFDDSRFARVVPNFIVQFGIPGDPRVTAEWKDRQLHDDPVRHANARGTIAYAMIGPNTRTHQFFISRVDNTRLDAQGFSPLGEVVDGMDAVDRIYSGYGETSGGGMRAGKQQEVLAQGNAWLDANFPKLDRLIRARIVPVPGGG